MIDASCVILLARTLLIFISLASAAHGIQDPPRLTIKNTLPLKVFGYEHGKSYQLSIPIDFLSEIEGIFDDVRIEDLTGDGVGEVVFRKLGESVNSCSRVLRYRSIDRSLVELAFTGGGLCNFRTQNSHIISSYKSGAAWIEDIYTIKGGRTKLKIF